MTHKMAVSVFALSGNEVARVEIEADRSVHDLHCKIEEITAIPTWKQKLAHGLHILDPGSTLEELDLHPCCEVNLGINAQVIAVTASNDATAKLWNSMEGDCLQTFEGHSGRVYSVSLSPDGTLVLTSSHDETAKLWSAEDGACLLTLRGHTGAVHFAAFSYDGAFVITLADDGAGKVWNVRCGECIHTFHGNAGAVVNSIAFSPVGESVLTAAADGTARLWSISGKTCLETLSMAHDDSVNSAVFSADGSLALTSSCDCTAKMWRLHDGTCMQNFSGHKDRLYSAFFSPDCSMVLTSCVDGTFKLWICASGICTHTFGEPGFELMSAVFSPDGTSVLAYTEDGVPMLWRPAERLCPQTTEWRAMKLDGSSAVDSNLGGHVGDINSAVFSADGMFVLTASHDRTTKLWHVITGMCVKTCAGHSGAVNMAQFLPERSTQLVQTDGKRRPSKESVAVSKEAAKFS
eukprot:gb/GFBE01035950.1/.p1 GENE.gb/GFBE01035950.1/~~gb/GFBE01035950.1/.p1  ORF type:complete len:463 (+),score=51.61 gb/GFBE01035950.1/:1-1389(+)